MEKQWRIGVAGVLVGMMFGYAGHDVLDRKTSQHSTQVRLEMNDVQPPSEYEPPLSRTDQLYTPRGHGTLIF
ncbi:hypothetical protein PS943_01197 [Pseudomonas fluorescens]|uniref:Uncharacterized protein n=1 Tax=Pseudomonas fluorescens TaxID=294 RepID=A0A5E7W2Z5_PSEFL|nr:hypothetical protein PS943_01197 [Pseudomonas fluorescens]